MTLPEEEHQPDPKELQDAQNEDDEFKRIEEQQKYRLPNPNIWP